MAPEIKYPPFGLQLSDGDLLLRIAEDSDLLHLCSVRETDIFAPNCPWVFPWIQQDNVALSTAQFQWGLRASNSPSNWALSFVAYWGGEFVGSIDMRAVNFKEKSCIETGSYVLRRFQGRGLGKRMRALVATYAFDFLGARELQTTWHPLNSASGGVSRALGYEVTGRTECGEHDRPEVHARLMPERFEARPELSVSGHTPELMAFLGASDTP